MADAEMTSNAPGLPGTNIWNIVNNLSGHAIIAGVLVYLMTVTLPQITDQCRSEIAQQAHAFSASTKDQRDQFMAYLMQEQKERQLLREEIRVLSITLTDLKTSLIQPGRGGVR